MFKVGDKVTRGTGRKVWEIATITEITADHAPLVQKVYGGIGARIYQLKDANTGKISKNIWWCEKDITAI